MAAPHPPAPSPAGEGGKSPSRSANPVGVSWNYNLGCMSDEVRNGLPL